MRFLLPLLLPVLAVAAVPPQAEPFSALYNLDYARAMAMFKKATEAQPANPEAWNHLAQAILHRRLFLEGVWQSDLVGRTNPFLRRPKVAMPADEQKRFLAAIERAMQLSRERMARDPDDPVALYALGISHAHRGNFRFLIQKSYFDALRDATRSRNLHNRLRHLDPKHPDALLVPGMHEYINGSLPALVRVLASMTGFRGNKKEGIRLVERAVREGRKTAVEARVMLSIVYAREDQHERAIPLLRELSQAFPRNHLYRSEVILMMARAGQRDDALAALQAMEKLKRDNAPELARMDAGRLKQLREAVEHRLKEKE